MAIPKSKSIIPAHIDHVTEPLSAPSISVSSPEEAEPLRPPRGVQPHLWLLAIVAGEPVLQRVWQDAKDIRGCTIGRELIEREVYPDLDTRISVAKSIAPFFAPKLSSNTVGVDKSAGDQVAAILADLAAKLPK